MDFSQALLCLISFNAPPSPTDLSNNSESIGVPCKQETQKVDLDFHTKALRKIGGQGIMDAGTSSWQVSPDNTK